MFLTRAGKLVVNEIAPRPHNSGHLTIEACDISQFEQQVRAICGLPLGSMRPHTHAAMVNLLGDLWHAGEPPWLEMLAVPHGYLHLYGKTEAKAGRKMGHFTVLGESADAAALVALESRRSLLKH
jgi:5-(carboxyamino)imidazole ribonucleotide synthase